MFPSSQKPSRLLAQFLAEGADTPVREKVRWLLRLRWLTLAALFIAALGGSRAGYLPPDLHYLFFSILLVGAGWNSYSVWILTRFGENTREQDLAVQFSADVALLTLLLLLSGGIYNPFSTVLLIYAVLAGLLLSAGALLFVLAEIALSLALLQNNPDVSRLYISGEVARPFLSAAYAFVALLLAALAFALIRLLSRSQRGLRVLQERQDRLDRLRVAGAMAAGLSHEFASPLYAARLSAERLQRKGGPAVEGDAAELIAAIGDCEAVLRSLAPEGWNPDSLGLEPADVSATISLWVDESRRALGVGEEIRLENKLKAGQPAVAPWGPLRRSFLDLVENALEASPGKRALVRLRAAEGRLRIEIENEGPPLAKIVSEKWGEPFITTKADGTGLGLYNAITLLRAMGGDLEYSRPGGGRTVLAMVLPGGEADDE